MSIEGFYILNHHPTPDIEPGSWTVSLTGEVDETELTMRELRESYPTTSVTATLECAGNGRTYFDSVDGEPERYVQWGDTGVSTARWTGTPLSAILDEHNATTDEGYWLTAIGGDAPEGEDIFARSLPMAKVIDDCLLAYRMSGETLPPEHGFPVRIIVPGWYGVNSVKWVEELRVMDRMIAGDEWEQHTRWQQDSYRMDFHDEEPSERTDISTFDTWEQLDDGVVRPYLYDQHVMSLIGSPKDSEAVRLGADGTLTVGGVAWAGDDRVMSVEVSTDGGDTWREAKLVESADETYRWQRFECSIALQPGEYTLVSRATDEQGRRQPAQTAKPGSGKEVSEDTYPWNREGYGNNAYLDYGVTFTIKE